MRGIVATAILMAAMAVADAWFFKGQHLKDAEIAITGLAGISTQMGGRR